jgi:hypothetical protein
MMRHSAWAAILTLAAASAHAKVEVSQETWLCAIGQYANADGTSTVEIGNGEIALDGACSMKPAKVRSTKKHTVLSARWAECQGFRGPVRVTAKLVPGVCDRVDVRVRGKKARRRFQATRSKGDPGDCLPNATFDLIERRIFGAKGCRVETCHGSAESGGLDLRLGAAHESLVGVAATAAPSALRVAPGRSADSFLVRKLAGALEPGEGDRMPNIGRPISPLELDLVRAWIDAGAPASGTVSEQPCLPPHRYEPAPPLEPPPGGYQIVYEGPTLQPGDEIEGCEWIEAPNSEDFLVGRWEYSLNPGTHHFAVWEHRAGAAMPELHTFKEDLACISGGAEFGVTLTGAPEAPYFVDDYPGDLARVVKGGSILGINPHYFNEFDEPVQIKLWINLYPAPAGATIADGFVSTDASLSGKSAYSIFVPPGTVQTLRLRWTNRLPHPVTIPQISSHMHQRGVRFDAWLSDGTPLYDNTDWAHPRILNFAPPLALAPGDYIEYQCTHDNGVTRPVRRCGDAQHDDDCTPGEPMPVVFNVTAQDEMCLLTGLLY